MNRLLAAAFAAVIALTLAACGDGSDTTSDSSTSKTESTPSETTTTEATDTADEGSSSDNADVKAYCDKIDQFVKDAQKVVDSKDQQEALALTQKASDLASAAQDLNPAELSSEDQKALMDCSNESAKALQDIAAAMTP